MSLVPVMILVWGVVESVDPHPWQHDQPKLSVDYLHGPLSNTVIKFTGNETHTDNFKIVRQDGNAVFVGGTNIIYILNAKDLSEHKNLRIHWPPENSAYELCTMKGKSKDECQNYIRVIARTDKHRLLVCGTHAFKPRCRHYKYKNGMYLMDQEFDGKGKTPYDPAHNSTYLLADGELYTATVSDFSGSDPLIYREPLRTEQYDSKILNTPDFVNTLEDENYIYFFFREQAVEYINCGKSVYSRVGRVCKNDQGGPNKFRNRWTTFLKSRLNCSIPGDYPFYFNHLQSTSAIVPGDYKGESSSVIYAVFTTPDNGIGGNAVCAFKMRDILDTFEGAFKEQETANSNWLPVRDNKVPDPRPGRCASSSSSQPESGHRFIQDHSIMDEAVPSYFGGKPLFIRANLQHPSQFREIVVVPEVATSSGESYNLVFIGTDRGQVLKMVHVGEKGRDVILVEELQVLAQGEPVLGLQLLRVDGVTRVLVVAADSVTALPVERCGVARSCAACVGLQDPYCGWHVVTAECVDHAAMEETYAAEFLQNVTTGRHRQCGDSGGPVLIEESKGFDGSAAEREEKARGGEMRRDENPPVLMRDRQGRFSTEEFFMAVVSVSVSALIIGFIAGFLVSRHCICGHETTFHVPYLDKPGYEEENIYAKVDDLTYFPVVNNQVAVEETDKNNKSHNIINNVLLTLPCDQVNSRTLSLHQVNALRQRDFNTLNTFGTIQRSQKIYL